MGKKRNEKTHSGQTGQPALKKENEKENEEAPKTTGTSRKSNQRPLTSAERDLRERERNARQQDRERKQVRKAVIPVTKKTKSTVQLAAIVILIILVFSAMVAIATLNNNNNTKAVPTATPPSPAAQQGTDLRAAGEAAYSSQKYAEAVKDYEQALQVEPTNPANVNVRINLGISYYKLKEYEQAKSILLVAVSGLQGAGLDDKDHLEAHLFLARTYDNLGDSKNALDEYQYTASSGEGNPNAKTAANEKTKLEKKLLAGTTASSSGPSVTVVP